mmetsp:Transcript_20538/g.45944  ORF Transcript_20538/g.45944 Transcript_20538/m.45944 type:complete len:219 (-) Transcript_20538:97-753(-)
MGRHLSPCVWRPGRSPCFYWGTRPPGPRGGKQPVRRSCGATAYCRCLLPAAVELAEFRRAALVGAGAGSGPQIQARAPTWAGRYWCGTWWEARTWPAPHAAPAPSPLAGALRARWCPCTRRSTVWRCAHCAPSSAAFPGRSDQPASRRPADSAYVLTPQHSPETAPPPSQTAPPTARLLRHLKRPELQRCSPLAPTPNARAHLPHRSAAAPSPTVWAL